VARGRERQRSKGCPHLRVSPGADSEVVLVL
jgi:hypothetical protein